MSESAVKRMYFPDGVAPFGELNLVRADFKRGYEHTLDVGLNLAAERIVFDAWLASGWLTRNAPQGALRELAGTLHTPRLQAGPHDAAKRGFYHPTKQTAWFAVKPPEGYRGNQAVGNGLIVDDRGRPSVIRKSQVVGFAAGKHDVSGINIRGLTTLDKMRKRLLKPEKVYAATEDDAVLPEYQGQKIGAALLHATLLGFGENQKPTTYVPALNPALIKKLSQLGFEETGRRPQTDLVPGMDIEMVRLQAESVLAVRTRLVEKYDWLGDYVRL